MQDNKEIVAWNVVFWCATFVVFASILETIQGSSVRNAYQEAYLHHRRKRATGCSEKYATITQGHSACLAPSSGLKNSGVSEEEKRLIVDTHNKVRREVDSASNMRELTWDDEIANTAQRWADHCRNTHDTSFKRYAYGRFSVGQNLSWGSWAMGWAGAIKLWSNEMKSFTYGHSQNTAVVGHYTQMVWAETSKVGCGYADCGNMHYYVCDYGPAGNMDITKPYKYGLACADCPSTCHNKLCDCRGKVCLNGGTMDLNTCQCACKKDLKFYIKPNCGLNCTAIQDPSWCRQYRPEFCSTYTNVPQECPDMCNLCPTAGVGYTTVSRASTHDRKSTVLSSRTSRYPSVNTHQTSRTSNKPSVNTHQTSRTSNKQSVNTYQSSRPSNYPSSNVYQTRRTSKYPSVNTHQSSWTSHHPSVNTHQTSRTSTFHSSHAAKQTDCLEKYSAATTGHSACLQRSHNVNGAGISEADKSLIVDTHNKVRRDVYSASNMRELTWDADIAGTAQRWAEHCQVGPDARYKRYSFGRFPVGQNLAWDSRTMDWHVVLNRWSSGIKSFSYGRKHNVGVVGMYTQMVWAETSKIGCGYANCGDMNYYICNYGPAGNSNISKPYTYGPSCGDCPSTCNNKLCDCRGRVCLNGGTMDLNTCQCTCNQESKFYIQPDCRLNCTGIQDPTWCRRYGPAGCERYANIPVECPDMCRWCPAAGVKGFETGASAWPDEGFKTPTVDKTDKQVKTKSKSADGHRKVGTSAWPDEGFKTPTVDTTDKQVRKAKSESADGHRKEPDGRQKYVYIKQVKGRKTYEIEGQSKGQLAPTSPNCSVKYATIVVGHSACSVPSRHVKRAGVSNVERSLILDTHNRIRMDVYSARDMQLLTWDTEIALTAQRWSENCKVESDNPYQRYAYGRFAVGQNLIWSTGDMGWPAVIGRWSSQVKRFHYGQADNVAAVEYAQIVSAETSKIGCGYADCGNMHYYVCNYGLASSLDISKPYTYGPACGDCPSTCNDKLCDCGGRVCLNGGTMDLHTCRCTCNMGLGFYTQPDCALNCTDIRDPAWCSQYALSDCETYVNVPQECPRMCNWCPAAGVEPPQVRPVSGTRRLQQSTITVLIISVINFIFYTSPRNTI